MPTPKKVLDKGNGEAHLLAMIPARLTPTQLLAKQKRLGFEHAVDFARALGIAESTLSRYLNGSRPIPRPLTLAIQAREATGSKTVAGRTSDDANPL